MLPAAYDAVTGPVWDRTVVAVGARERSIYSCIFYRMLSMLQLYSMYCTERVPGTVFLNERLYTGSNTMASVPVHTVGHRDYLLESNRQTGCKAGSGSQALPRPGSLIPGV